METRRHRIRLFRRREVWLPTLTGVGVLLLATVLVILFAARNCYFFLAVNEPVIAKTLVVEGWVSPAELQQVVVIFRSGKYERVITTGGPVNDWRVEMGDVSYAEVAANYLTRLGIPRKNVFSVPAPASAQERTFLSAVMLRKWARRQNIELDAINLFSSGSHARRSRILFQQALGTNVKVGVLAGQSEDFEGSTWWRTSTGAESVLRQLIGYVWVKLFFWPAPPDTEDELWGISTLRLQG